MSAPVLLVLGPGPKIGPFVTHAFAAKGYKIALTARSVEASVDEDGYLRPKIDLRNTTEIQKVLAKVRETFGIPTVIVFNSM